MTAALAPCLKADWKLKLVTRLNTSPPDYRAVLDGLEGDLPKIEPGEAQAAHALLPFLAGLAGDRKKEEDGMVFYMETYQGADPDLAFLDEVSFRQFLVFWKKWISTYPLVTKLTFLVSDEDSSEALPTAMAVGLELRNAAVYRVSLGKVIIEGGYWPPGWHVLTIPTADIVKASGNYDFLLDLKAGDIILRKPIRLAVDVRKFLAADRIEPVKPVMPEVRKRAPLDPRPSGRAVSGMQGLICLYIDDKLVTSSRKFAPTSLPMEITIPGPNMSGQLPYYPPPRDDIMARSVSIPDAIALTFKAIRDLLFKKDKPTAFRPYYQRVTTLHYTFTTGSKEDGNSTRTVAQITLSGPPVLVLRD